jgi:phosphonate transport system ATP-binding protein
MRLWKKLLRSTDLSNLKEANRGFIQLDDVHVIYDHVCALDIQRLAIHRGERVFLLGRSGSGKTTLMRVIKARHVPTTGRIRVDDEDPFSNSLAERRAMQRRIAMIDQEFYLIPRMRVIDNVLTGSLGRVSTWKSLFGWYPSEEWVKAERILSEVGLEGLGNRRVETLSGGQRQRAAIARALMQEAEIILADEPISNLDPELAEDALDLLVACVKRRNVTLIVSLHQPSLAKRFATRLIGLSEGCVIYDGAPEELTPELSDIVYRDTLPEDEIQERKDTHDDSSKSVEAPEDSSNIRLLRR